MQRNIYLVSQKDNQRNWIARTTILVSSADRKHNTLLLSNDDWKGGSNYAFPFLASF